MDPLPVVWTRFGLASDSGPNCVYCNNCSIFGPAPRCLDSLWTRFGLGFDYVYHNNCSVLDPLPVWPIYYYRGGERESPNRSPNRTHQRNIVLGPRGSKWAPGPLWIQTEPFILQYLLFVAPGALAFLKVTIDRRLARPRTIFLSFLWGWVEIR